MKASTYYGRVVLLMSSILLGTALPTYARTPDGMPPAKEGACDVLKLKGVTPALHGLCVAYCEALDCDQAGDQVAQCTTAGNQLLERYNALKKATDPQMPCIQRCPCWTAQEIGAIGFSWSPHELDFFPNDLSPAYIRYTLVEIGPSQYQYADVWYYPQQQPAAACIFVSPSTFVSQDISVSEADACKEQITQQIEDLTSKGIPVACVGNLCP